MADPTFKDILLHELKVIIICLKKYHTYSELADTYFLKTNILLMFIILY